jgi:hypothetical protein
VLFFRTTASKLAAGEEASKQLLDATALSLARHPCPVLLVGFSGAMYIFGAFLTLLEHESPTTCAVRRHLAGFLADSPIHRTDAVRGVASVITNDLGLDVPLRNATLHYGVRALVWLAYTLAWPWVGASHIRSNRNVETLPHLLEGFAHPCTVCG